MELLVSLLSVLGVNSILLFFVKRYFDRRDRREELEKAMDAIREKFGKGSIQPARDLGADLLHLPAETSEAKKGPR